MRSVLTISSLAGFLLVTGCAMPPAPKWAPPTQAELGHPLSLGECLALARVEVRQAEAELQDARDETRAQRLALAFALGADRPVPVHLQDTALTIPAEIDQATTASEGVPEALLIHAPAEDPPYAQAKAARQAAEAELQLQYRRILPLSETQASAERKHAPDGMSGTFSFETPIPVLNWNQAGVKKAKAELLAAQAEEETARREVAAGLSEAWEAWRTARNRHRVFSEQITKDRAQLAGDARDLFTSGRIGYTELLQARREWRQAELSAVESWRVSMISAWRVLCQLGYNETEPSDKKET